MYKKTNPQQKLFGVGTQLSASLRNRLETSWAHLFKTEILPILFKNEDQYAILYGKTGRPNFSVARMLGLCLLQEFNNLSDQQALDTFSFDIRWRYALDISDEGDYLSRRSLVEFRRRLAAKDPEMKLVRNVFDTVRNHALKKLGLSTGDQRVDSTHVISNIRIRGRLSLFSDTISNFLKSLNEDQFSKIPEAIQKWHTTDPEGWFGLGPSEQRDKLQDLACYLYKLIMLFEHDNEVINSEPYQLLNRLFSEQCELKSDLKTDEGSSKIQVKKTLEGGTNLQSPYDPDASFGHKGTGYSVHITETCNNSQKTEMITDYEVHGAGRSDIGKALSVVERLDDAGLKPKTLFADGGYPSVPSALKITEQGVEFIAPVNRGPLSDKITGRDSFDYNSEGFVTKCPMGHSPIDHRMLSHNNKKGKSLHAIFNGDTCRKCSQIDSCPVRAPNHRSKGCRPRDTIGNFRLEVTPGIILRDKMYSIQKTPEWKERYSIRAGIEATNSELKRVHGLAKLRVRRIAKVCFAIACKLIACNIKRWARAQKASKRPLYSFLSILRIGIQYLFNILFGYHFFKERVFYV
ncbi:MAG: transposase [Desulfatiglans sp.]|nr:transposase [Desulfatiglans sp.]